MSTYADKLRDDRWQERRIQIIGRDKHVCQSCNNSKLINSSLTAIIYDFQIQKIKENLYKIVFLAEGGGFVDLLCNLESLIQENVKIYYQRNGERKRDLKLIAIRSLSINEQIDLHEKLLLLGNDENKSRMEGVRISTNIKEHISFLNSKKGNKDKFSWFRVNNLHVHHKYYQLGKEPWEYPDDALITLCESCHHDFHEFQKVDVLDVNGKKFDEYTACERCFGEGYLLEYSYYLDGICFRCNGARYDERIVRE